MSNPLKHLLFIILIIVFSFFACHKLFNSSFYTSHDGEGHVIRMIEYDEAWDDGQIPVRITKRINYGLGYPFFNFNYPLPYFLGEMAHLSGLSFVESFKFLLILSVIIGGLSMYMFMLSHVGKIASCVSALFYIFVPYRFLNMYVRGNPAESLALSLLPLFLYSADKLIRSKGKNFGLFVFVGSVFILSHNTTVLIGLPVIAGYIAIQLFFVSPVNQVVKRILMSCVFIGCITSFFWIPVVVESGLTKLSELSEDYQFFFPAFREVLYSPWGFGAYKQGFMPGKMSPQIGVLHIAFFVISIILIGYKTVRRIIIPKTDWRKIFFICITMLALFFTLPISRFLWDTIPLLRMVQLPWRFLGIIALGCSIMAGFVVASSPRIPKFLHVVGCIVVIIVLLYTNRNHIRVNMYTDFSNPFDRSPTYGFSTTSKDEHMPKLAPRIHENPNPDGDMIPSEAGLSKKIVWKSNLQEFIVQATVSAEFRANVSYFPGWRAFLDDKPVPIIYTKDEYRRLRIVVPAGTHKVVFRFGEPWYRFFADILSLVAVVCVIGIMVQRKGKNL